MACLDMYNQNNEQYKGQLPGAPPPITPRISFSNDFVDSSSSSSNNTHSHHHHHHHHHQMIRGYRDAPVSSDFEFSVANYSMMSADELFSKGKLLPFKQTCTTTTPNQMQKTTLRDELLVVDDDTTNHDFSLKPPKSSNRWKGFLGLKRSHSGSKKVDKTEPSLDNNATFAHQDLHSTNNSQETNARDFEFRL